MSAEIEQIITDSCLDQEFRAYTQAKKSVAFRKGVHAVQSKLIFHTELSGSHVTIYPQVEFVRLQMKAVGRS